MAASAIILPPTFPPYKLPLQLITRFTQPENHHSISLQTLSSLASMAKTILLLLVTALFVQHLTECSSRGASSVEIMHRQLFLEMKKLGLKKPVPNHGNNEMQEGWQLRLVPSGPDPLHHNRQAPEKPRTP